MGEWPIGAPRGFKEDQWLHRMTGCQKLRQKHPHAATNRWVPNDWDGSMIRYSVATKAWLLEAAS